MFVHALVSLPALSEKSALSARQNFGRKMQQDSHEVCTQMYQYVPAWNQYVPENAQSCTAIYCHTLPCTAMYCHVLPKVRTCTYSYVLWAFVCSSTYRYVPVCTDIRKITKITYRYIHHKSTIRYVPVRTATYRYVQTYTRCIGFQTLHASV